MRLFWRILIGYWLAWALLSLGVFGALTLAQRAGWPPHPVISEGRPASFLVAHLAVSLHLGGEPLVRALADSWPAGRGEPPFVVDAGGREVLGRQVAPEVVEEARRLAVRGDGPAPAIWEDGPDGRTYVLFYPESRGPGDRSWLRWLFEWPWLFAVALALASLLFAGRLAISLSRPIQALKAAFDALAAGRLETRVGPAVAARRDEIGGLGRHFDTMASRLGQSIDAQRQLLHDVSHELRSPLARLGVAAELARRRPDRTDEALDRIERERAKLERLIGEVLTLSRLEAGAADSLDDYVDLVELLRVIVEDATFEASAEGVTIDLQGTGAEEVVLRGNGELLHRAVENVVRNAIQHAGRSDRIEIRLAAAADRVEIRVRDHGEGVTPEALRTLFDPFTRARSSTGFGLGLAIARRAVEVHRGTIAAHNHPEGGLEVEIRLPRTS